MHTTSSRCRRRCATWAVLALTTVTLNGCTSSNKSTPSAVSTQPSTATPTAPATAATALSPAQVVAQVTLSANDLPSGDSVALIEGGDQVAGQVTLDNCGYTFTTEAHRVARRQVKILSARGQETGMANEVVAYDSEQQAAKALTEFRTSINRCPRNVYQASTVAGVPSLRYDVASQMTDAQLPVADNTDATIAVSAQGSHQRLYGILIFQRRGTILDGVYLQSPVPPSAAVVATVRTLAKTAGSKLASR